MPDALQIQLDLSTEEAQDRLRNRLLLHGWQTRRELCQTLGWSERQVRETAESMGSEIVRGQAGFKLTCQIDRRSDDFLVSMQAADAAISQGKKMIRYGLALKRRLHGLVEG